MARILISIIFFMLLISSAACGDQTEVIHEQNQIEETENAVLVFSKTDGFRHDSIEEGAEAVKQLGNENGFSVTWTEEPEYFTTDNLSNYDAVIFMNTTQTLFDEAQRNAF